MPKKRSKSQRIGTIGEHEFTRFCDRNWLIPNKIQNDFGFDFMCQVDSARNRETDGYVSGTFFLFSVRATERPDGRIQITQPDAECLLSADVPTGLVLVHVSRQDEVKVFFRFLDKEFATLLHNFLESGNTTRSFTSADMRPEASFTSQLGELCASGYVESIRVAVAKEIAEPIMGGVHIQVHRSDAGQVTLATALDLYSCFERGNKDERKALRLATFGTPRFRSKRIKELALKGGLIRPLSQLPKPFILVGFTTDDPTQVRVKCGTKTKQIELSKTSNVLHYGYVHEAGLAFTVSLPKKRSGGYVHETRTLVDQDSDTLLSDYPDLVKFLTFCKPGATITFGSDPGLTLAVEYFRNLDRCVNIALALSNVEQLGGWSDIIRIEDMASEESYWSIAWLDSAATMDNYPFPKGLVIGDTDESACEPVPAAIRVPVVCNLVSKSIVAWLSGPGVVLHQNGEACGFRVSDYDELEIEFVKRIQKESVFPEARLGNGISVILNPKGITYASSATEDWDNIHVTWTLA